MNKFVEVQTNLAKNTASQNTFQHLHHIVQKMSVQTQLCERSLIAHNSSLSSKLQPLKKFAYELLGHEYNIPSIESAFESQLQLVSQYSTVLDTLVQKGESELHQLQKRIDDLDKYTHNSHESSKTFENHVDETLLAYEKIKSRHTRRDLMKKTNDLGLQKIHTSISQSVLGRLDSLELLLTDAVFSTKKLREEARGYEHYLYSAIQPYLTLGASSHCITQISEHIGVMKEFTGNMENHVADSLAQIHVLSYQSQNENNPRIEKNALGLEESRLTHLQQYD